MILNIEKIEVECPVCHKIFKKNITNKKKKYCSIKCYRLANSRQNKNLPIDYKFWKRQTILERFYLRINWEKFSNKETDCWEFLGCRNHNGYVTIVINKKRIRAHILSWNIHFGEISKGLLVCHKCDNPCCVRPDHLFIGTQKDNMIDMCSKERNPNRKLNKEKVNLIRKEWNESNKKYGLKKSLSKKFEVDEKVIANVINNKAWKYV